jgi:undecaprenyl-diphosphatase
MQAILLALVQGISEFLPVSSSAHLVLPAQLLGWPDQGLAFDIAVHAGTLFAVLIYFRHDLWLFARSLLPSAWGFATMEVGKLGLATVPAVLTGLLLSRWIEETFRGIPVIATTTLVFGLLLAWVARHPVPESADDEQVSWLAALLIGCAQVLALIPGTSRSGITITAAMLLGYNAHTAARFSFLMSIPVIAGALLFLLLDDDAFAVSGVSLAPTVVAALLAFLSAWATIALFLRLLARVGLMPFAIYRIGLAAVLFTIVFVRGL